jgi:BirA family transcriptional regulator, biotin operon repressor / biotin---[acetyl-CoA-carboxylase] ligase
MIVDERTRAHLARSTRFADIREFATIGSTNSYLLQEARAGAPEGTVVVADHQTTGKGRLGRTWTASPGASLLVSVLFRPARLKDDRRHLLTAAVALASARACTSVAGIFPEIKWPNDLLMGDRKLAGILAEAEHDAVVVGVGMNVASAPPGAVSVDEAARRPVARGELLGAILEDLEGWYRDLPSVAAAYRLACGTIGKLVRVELPGGAVAGQAEGVDDRGHLLVRREDGSVLDVAAGDVVHVRPS